ncbi:unnamed protein product [Didymodactylos carnosus]|uniref:Transglutaminase-like domain-containing protein n=1 Tax=Didymodactylos carnosus TaxID=1234261 RepID=A0A814EVP4_9BILA|nr:unnamed protein product [Didymodactylos carnosus]CAF1340069.1 unnamed protein product [Didymodactylos carnosus]CAF3747343.1 unnamed protein product [Didymodactylos carnosus]CAF4151314.1 unnamed protein product [Didymodactylos carnosus]
MGCKQVKIYPTANDSQTTTSTSKSTRKTSDIDLSSLDPNAFNSKLCQQRQNAIDNMTYRRTIDSWTASSIQQLVNYIKEFSSNKNTVDKAWIIFYWISQNISYDDASYFSGRIPTQATENVFQSKKAVCEGYACLFKKLCDEIGLKCEKISGYAKGYSYNPRKSAFDDVNHAWNVLQIDDHWYFIEATWGSGHIEKGKRFKKELDTHNFFCRPEHMIYKHLPTDNKWQLLARPITMNEYLRLPNTHSAFFELGLEIVTPKYSQTVHLQSGKSYAELLVKTPDDVELLGSLKDSLEGEDIEGAAQVYFDRQKSLWICQFAPQRNGMHNITIFAKKKTSPGSFHGAIEFILDVKDLKTFNSYPHTWSHFYEYGLQIVAPNNSRSAVWPVGASYCEILIHSPENVLLSGDIKYDDQTIEQGNLVQYDIEKRIWQCLFAPTHTGLHKITIFAKNVKDGDVSHCAVRFDLNVNELKQPMSFPLTYGGFQERKCKIYEPLNGILKRNTDVTFYCRIPDAKEVNLTVDSNWLVAEGYEKNVLKRTIKVGTQDVSVWTKYGNSYTGVLKYKVT